MNDFEYIKLAKEAIASEFSKSEIKTPIQQEFKEEKGVFVTIKLRGELRGCIGFPYASYPLGDAIILAAKSAAFADPRFPPMSEEEFHESKIEVSVLSSPIKMLPDPTKIKIGTDGLICDYRGRSGLLLPQVAVEHNLSPLEFLEALCEKAGLAKNSWKDEGFQLWKFKAKIFEEDELTKEGKAK
jgi:AmmeMemoRadiSam system protein A